MTVKSLLVEKRAYDSLGIGYPELPLDEPLQMLGLGSIVLLAGPNGGGKSRLLRMLPRLVRSHLNSDGRRQKQEELADLKGDIESWKAQILKLETSDAEDRDAELRTAREKLAQVQERLQTLESRLRMTEVVEVAPGQQPAVIDFVPAVALLESPAEVPDAKVDERAGRMRLLGSNNAQENAPAYVRGVLRAATLAGRSGRGTSAEDKAALENEKALLDLMSTLMGSNVRLQLGSSLNLEIGGVSSNLDSLSPGQQVLFQFACMLHAQQADLGNCVVLMDEPENHLHPKVLVEVVDRIISSLAGGQLWVATHSVPLVAHLAADDSSCLWLVDDGKVKSAKRAPADVLYSLMGGPDGTERLRDFLRLPEHFATVRFLAQCLEPPGVVGVDVTDPQTTQIRDIVHASSRKLNKKLRLLDFGAGKARLLRTLADGSTNPADWLDYFAFDIDPTNEASRIAEIKLVYPDSSPQERSLDSRALETGRIDNGSVHVIVMCNVLHEIDPDEWRHLFGTEGQLSRLLHPQGHLLIVEDYGIAIGERAHRYGFLLLDEPELVNLFDVKEADRKSGAFVRSSPQNSKFKDRLVAHLVAADCVRRFTAATQRTAIQSLKSRMAKDLKTLLAVEKAARSSHEGRTYARTAQLAANAGLWCDDHPG